MNKKVHIINISETVKIKTVQIIYISYKYITNHNKNLKNKY